MPRRNKKLQQSLGAGGCGGILLLVTCCGLCGGLFSDPQDRPAPEPREVVEAVEPPSTEVTRPEAVAATDGRNEEVVPKGFHGFLGGVRSRIDGQRELEEGPEVAPRAEVDPRGTAEGFMQFAASFAERYDELKPRTETRGGGGVYTHISNEEKGNRYHSAGCRFADHAVLLSVALARGYTECGICGGGTFTRPGTTITRPGVSWDRPRYSDASGMWNVDGRAPTGAVRFVGFVGPGGEWVARSLRAGGRVLTKDLDTPTLAEQLRREREEAAADAEALAAREAMAAAERVPEPAKEEAFAWPEEGDGDEWIAAGGLKVAIAKYEAGHPGAAAERARAVVANYPGTRVAAEAERLAAEWEAAAPDEPVE